MAVREHEAPNRLGSAFRIGSLSKQFASALVMHFQERGLLKVDDEFSRFFAIPEHWRGITLKHLMTHTSGLAVDLPFDAKSIAAYHTPEEILTLAKTVPLAHSEGPGRKFLYSNLGYTLLALVLQEVARTPYPELVEETLTRTLGLSQTGSDHDSLITPLMSQGYTRTPYGESRECCLEILNLLGAGDLRSSAVDLSTGLDILLENRFLSDASRSELWAPRIQMEHEGKALDGVYYGSVPGFVSDLAYWPNEKKRVIVLSNIREYAWNADQTQLLPVSTASLIRVLIEKVLFPPNEALRH